MNRLINIIIINLLTVALTAQSFMNVAMLKQASWLGNGAHVTVHGFYTAGDAGDFSARIDHSGDNPDDVFTFQIGTGDLRAKRIITESTIDVKKLGIKYRNVSKPERIRNWQIIKIAYNNLSQVTISDTIELEATKNDSIHVDKEFLFNGVGRDKSILSLFPKYKSFRGNVKYFYHQGGDITFDKVAIEGYSHRWSYETYSVMFRPSGDIDALQIDAGESIRNGFWSNLSIGDTLAYQLEDAFAGGIRVVTSFDSTSRIIQTNGTFSTSDDFQTSGSFIGRPWPETSNISDVETYSEQWNTINYEQLYFMQGVSSSKASDVVFRHGSIKGVDIGFQFISDNASLFLSNLSLQANSIGVSWSGASASQYARTIIRDSEIYDCATLSEASINPNGPIISNDRFGGGVYIHPGVIPYCENVRFRNNNSTSFRNFSSSTNDITGEGWKGTFKDCTWESNNKEPLLITSKSFSTSMINCKVLAPHDSGVSPMYIGNSFSAVDCVFDVPLIFNRNSEPSDFDSVRYEIDILGSTFYENGRLSALEWPGQALNKTDINISDCSFFPGSKSSGYTITLGAGTLTLDNIKVKRRLYDSTHALNDFIVIDSSQVDVPHAKIILKNIEYDSTMNHTFIASANNSLPTSLYEIELFDSEIKADSLTDGNIAFTRLSAKSGTTSGTTDVSGDLIVTHNYGASGYSVSIKATGTTFYHTQVHSKTADTFTVRIFDENGSAVSSASVNIDWTITK